MLNRRDLTRSQAEAWQPPPLSASGGRLARMAAGLRRFLDLQNGSIWRDLKVVLAASQGTVLDVGCGAQPYRGLVPAGCSYLAIDHAKAREHFGYEAAGTTYFEGERWPVPDETADVLLCTEALEHVPEPGRFLAEAFRCLKPGGRLLLTVPFAARWHFIPHDYWRFTPSSLQLLLGAAGFREVAVYARGNALTVACYKGMALILPLLLPQNRGRAAALGLRLLGLTLAPLLGVLAVVGNLSLRGAGGDDCLGYTVLASRGSNRDASQVTRQMT